MPCIQRCHRFAVAEYLPIQKYATRHIAGGHQLLEWMACDAAQLNVLDVLPEFGASFLVIDTPQLTPLHQCKVTGRILAHRQFHGTRSAKPKDGSHNLSRERNANDRTHFNFSGNLLSTRMPSARSNMPICTFGLSSARHVTKPYARLSFIGTRVNDSTRALLPNRNRSVCFSFTTPDAHFHEIMLPASVQPYSNFGFSGSHCWPTIFLPSVPSNSRIHSPVDVLYARTFVSHMMNKMLQKPNEM